MEVHRVPRYYARVVLLNNLKNFNLIVLKLDIHLRNASKKQHY